MQTRCFTPIALFGLGVNDRFWFWYRHFLHCSSILLYSPPNSTLSTPFPPSQHLLTFQALEGAPSDQLMQQSQMPQYYAQQPWVPKTSVQPLSFLNLLIYPFLSYISSRMVSFHKPTWVLLLFIASVSSLRGFVSDFNLHRLVNRMPWTHGQCNTAAQFQKHMWSATQGIFPINHLLSCAQCQHA